MCTIVTTRARRSRRFSPQLTFKLKSRGIGTFFKEGKRSETSTLRSLLHYCQRASRIHGLTFCLELDVFLQRDLHEILMTNYVGLFVTIFETEFL